MFSVCNAGFRQAVCSVSAIHGCLQVHAESARTLLMHVRPFARYRFPCSSFGGDDGDDNDDDCDND